MNTEDFTEQDLQNVSKMQHGKSQLEEYSHVVQTWFEINSNDFEMGPEDRLLQILKASVNTTYMNKQKEK